MFNKDDKCPIKRNEEQFSVSKDKSEKQLLLGCSQNKAKSQTKENTLKERRWKWQFFQFK